MDSRVDDLLVIVVGAHPRAEAADRALAHTLIERIRQWQTRHVSGEFLRPVICTDLWYLNDRDLQARPTIAVGNPSVNAASAWLANRLPCVFVAEQAFQIQLDPELVDHHACLWGVERQGTAAAISTFVDRWMDSFLRAAHGQASGAA